MPQEPFATIENLVKLAKKEIAKVGFAEFKSAIISSKDKCENINTTVICTCQQDFEGKSQEVGTNFLERIKPFVEDLVWVTPKI